MPPPTQVPGQAPLARRPVHKTPLRQRAATLPSAEVGSSPLTRPSEYKVIVLGDSGVGKSSLIRQFVQKTFDERLMATVGCDFSNKVLSIDAPVVSLHDPVKFGRAATAPTTTTVVSSPPPIFEDAILNGVSAGPSTRVVKTALQIWDTAGGERHNTLGSIFFRGADACLLVFDVTSRRSFESLDGWANEFQRHVPNRVPMIVVGNKSDKPGHEVSVAEVVRFCEKRGFTLLGPDWCAFAVLPTTEADADASSAAAAVGASSPTPAADDERSGSPQQTPAPVAAAAALHEERSQSQSSSSCDASSSVSREAANLLSLDLPLRPAFLHASAASYPQVEPVFATLAMECVLRGDIAAVRAQDGVRLALISAAEAASSLGLQDTLGPSAAVRPLSREGSSKNLRDLAAADKNGGKPKPKKKCDC